MKKQSITAEIFSKKSYLCIGLDTDWRKLPPCVHKEKDPIFAFNRRIIDATANHCVAYKLNLAFYESAGPKGWESLAQTLTYIPKNIFTIADAKRGDIGNTSDLYAYTFFKQYPFQAVTVSPYMGKDSIEPFLNYADKWTILLALTSNRGSEDFQHLVVGADNKPLYQVVVERAMQWGSSEQLMFVVGATQPEGVAAVRRLAPDYFLLVPGYGAQKGDLEAVSKAGLTRFGGLLVNASRAILYASSDNNFDKEAQKQAQAIAMQMSYYLEKYACQ